MKKIAHLNVITKYFYPVTAGIETNILETYSKLVNLGWSVTVHTTEKSFNEKKLLEKTATVRGIKIIRYSPFAFAFNLPLSRHTGLLCLHNFNIFPHSLFLLRAFIKGRFHGKSNGIFLTPHGGYNPEWPTFSPPARLLKQIYHLTLGKFLVNHTVDAVRAISLWEKKELEVSGINKSKIVLIQNGLDPVAKLDHRSLASYKVKKIVAGLGSYIIAIGRISPVKNYETVLKALAQTKDLNLALVGPTENSAYYQSLVELTNKLGIKSRVVFLGVVRGSDKYYLLEHSLALVHLARWESFCNVVYEAMSLGKLCITADNTALRSLIHNGRTGLRVRTFDSAGLAKHLRNLGRKESLKVQDKIHQNLLSQKYQSWDQTAYLMHQVYGKIINKYV
ncbi:MAG: Glycosyltransferase [Microgenomates group bacterium GW2011_GWF2_47_9]|nr:MAG: Glycosyltransferase [Microgenomates group bacterium GW2011_GWF2_47_9]